MANILTANCFRLMLPKNCVRICLNQSDHFILRLMVKRSVFSCYLGLINRTDNIHSIFPSHLTISFRSMAKGKDKLREKKADLPKVILDDEEMESVIRYDEFKAEVQLIIENLKEDLKLNYNNKMNTKIIENLEIKLDGMKIQLGDIVPVVRKQNDLIINLAAMPNAVKPTLQAIQESGLNLNPQPDGNVIYIKLPKITSEYRQSMINSLKLTGQKTVDQIKNRNFHKKFYVKSGKKISEDLQYNVQANLMHFVKQKCLEIDNIIKEKQAALSEN